MTNTTHLPTVRCEHCKLNQFDRETCRRCKRDLHPPASPAAPDPFTVVEATAKAMQGLVAKPLRKLERKHVTETSRAIGRVLRDMRSTRSCSQKDFAAKLGLTIPYLCELELGRRNPSMQTLVSLATSMGLSSSELLYMAELDMRDTATANAVRFGVKSARCAEAFKEMTA